MEDATDTRDRILACASEIHASAGLAGLTMRAVASCAGLSATAIYRHFEDKEALLAAGCQAGFRRFGSVLWQALPERDPEARLVATGGQYAAFALAHPQYYRVIFMSSVHALGFERIPAENRDQFGASFRFLVDRVRECMEAGIVANADPVETAVTIWAHVHGLCSLYLDGHLGELEPPAFLALYDRSRARLLDGLRA